MVTRALLGEEKQWTKKEKQLNFRTDTDFSYQERYFSVFFFLLQFSMFPEAFLNIFLQKKKSSGLTIRSLTRV